MMKSNKLLLSEIRPALTASALGQEITILDEVDSTNTLAKKKAAEGAAHGTVIIADTQTSGRGRLGRTFVSPKNTGIYMSVIVRPSLSLEISGLITSAAAVAAAEAVEELIGTAVSIKWVNDIWLGGRKICGILTESAVSPDMKSLSYAVIGIGINVRTVRGSLPDELLGTATSIEDETGQKIDRNILCGKILSRLESHLDKIADKEFLAGYRSRELLTGHQITANVGGKQISGKAVGVDDNANLIVELPDGSAQHLTSGEANLCRICGEK